jgi:hypothetical protein
MPGEANGRRSEADVRSENVKSILTIAVQIGGIGVAFAGGVWAAAWYASGQENRYIKLEYRVEQIEQDNKGLSPSRLDRVEYRIDQMEKTNIEDRASRRQFEGEMKAGISEIKDTLMQVQIFLGPKLPRR